MTPAMRAFIEANEPCTFKQIADALSVTVPSVRKHYTHGDMHIVGWHREPKGNDSALLVLGSGRDAPKPLPLTTAEKNRRYRERNRTLIAHRRAGKKVIALGPWRGLI